MKTDVFTQIVGRLMRRPAVAYHESLVADEVLTICREQGIPVEADRFGNLYARHERGGRGEPVVLAAHMDHPGFEIIRKTGPKRWLARFLGGVPDSYFRRGVKLRLLPSGEAAVLGRRVEHKREQRFELLVKGGVSAKPEFAVWELTDFSVRRGRVHGRACDDLIGVAVILATLIELKERRAKCKAIGFISRAEEVGFQGALAAAGAGLLPKRALTISLETSRDIPGVKMGRGVIVRVGDRSSVFDSLGTRFLSVVGEELAGKKDGFQCQRALMGGGSCEGTAFQEFGLRAAAVCVALGNYHNCGGDDRIREEFVSLDDAWGMQRLLTRAAMRFNRFEPLTGMTRERLERLRREGVRRLEGQGRRGAGRSRASRSG